jgi:hypothetical protein
MLARARELEYNGIAMPARRKKVVRMLGALLASLAFLALLWSALLSAPKNPSLDILKGREPLDVSAIFFKYRSFQRARKLCRRSKRTTMTSFERPKGSLWKVPAGEWGTFRLPAASRL